MSRRANLDRAVAEFCQDMGLADTTLDDTGQLTLNFADLPVTLSYSDDPVEILWISADMGAIPAEGTAGPVFLLRLAYDYWTLNRMTLGLGPDGQRVWGVTCIPAVELTGDRLKLILDRLLEAALPLRERLAGGDFSLPDDAKGSFGPETGMMPV